ncbi:MAG: right-handed parallel beta-helix repeat-containing protein [Phycisphaerae bacterium]|nr:right-handed parallel beta-helix repeat-containing protein [Phycisphaerae bacterium]
MSVATRTQIILVLLATINTVRIAPAMSAATAGDPVYKLASSYPPGWDARDATRCLQNAINATDYDILVVDPQAAPWLVGPITIPSNKRILFPANLKIVAIDDNRRWRWNTCMFSIMGRENVTLEGRGTGPAQASLQMLRDKYLDPKAGYGSGSTDARHCITVGDSDNITISGLRIIDPGGDGIYVGGGSRDYSKNIKINNCTIENYTRCGIAAVSVAGLSIDGCVITDPRACGKEVSAIDLEPNPLDDYMQNVAIKDTDIHDCPEDGLAIALCRLAAGDPDVSIEVRDTRIHNIYGGSFPWAAGIRIKKLTSSKSSKHQPMTAPSGTILFNRCDVYDVDSNGLLAHWYVDDPMQLSFIDCSWKNVARTNHGTSPLYIKMKGLPAGKVNPRGGIRFAGKDGACKVIDSEERPFLRLDSYGAPPNAVINLAGSITAKTPGGDTPNRAADLKLAPDFDVTYIVESDIDNTDNGP